MALRNCRTGHVLAIPSRLCTLHGIVDSCQGESGVPHSAGFRRRPGSRYHTQIAISMESYVCVPGTMPSDFRLEFPFLRAMLTGMATRWLIRVAGVRSDDVHGSIGNR